jgi:hypothetical protein
VTAEGEGVKVESSASFVASTPEVADQKVIQPAIYLVCSGGKVNLSVKAQG